MHQSWQLFFHIFCVGITVCPKRRRVHTQMSESCVLVGLEWHFTVRLSQQFVLRHQHETMLYNLKLSFLCWFKPVATHHLNLWADIKARRQTQIRYQVHAETWRWGWGGRSQGDFSFRSCFHFLLGKRWEVVGEGSETGKTKSYLYFRDGMVFLIRKNSFSWNVLSSSIAVSTEAVKVPVRSLEWGQDAMKIRIS